MHPHEIKRIINCTFARAAAGSDSAGTRLALAAQVNRNIDARACDIIISRKVSASWWLMAAQLAQALLLFVAGCLFVRVHSSSC